MSGVRDTTQGPPADVMACSELVELVTEYLESVLPTPQLVRFEEHLADCPPCRLYLGQMRETIVMTGRLTEESMQPEAREALLEAFRDWKKNQ